MARARVCDRCGKYYPHYNDENTIGVTSFNIDNEAVSAEQYYDLCPECQEEFRDWLFGKDYTDLPVPEKPAELNEALHREFEKQIVSDDQEYLNLKMQIKEALDKQKPMVPEGDFDSVPHYRCPTCNSAVVTYRDDPHNPYCQWCGQALDWESAN